MGKKQSTNPQNTQTLPTPLLQKKQKANKTPQNMTYWFIVSSVICYHSLGNRQHPWPHVLGSVKMTGGVKVSLWFWQQQDKNYLICLRILFNNQTLFFIFWCLKMDFFGIFKRIQKITYTFSLNCGGCQRQVKENLANACGMQAKDIKWFGREKSSVGFITKSIIRKH